MNRDKMIANRDMLLKRVIFKVKLTSTASVGSGHVISGHMRSAEVTWAIKRSRDLSRQAGQGSIANHCRSFIFLYFVWQTYLHNGTIFKIIGLLKFSDLTAFSIAFS